LKHLHYEFDAAPSDTIEVSLDHAANVQLLDDDNYQKYQDQQTFDYHGGHAKTSPFRLHPPYQGHWHIVIDLGGGAGSVRAAVKVVPKTAP